MSDDDAKRSRIKAKVAASQARQKRDAPTPPPRKRAPKDDQPEDDRAFVRKYPWLVVGGGIAAGLVLAALLPRGIGRRFGKRALTAATVGGEVALAFSKQARDAALEAGREGRERLGELSETVGGTTADLRERAVSAGGAAARQARSTGLGIAREAIRLAARVRR